MKRLDVTVQSFGWSDRAKARLFSRVCPVGGALGQRFRLSLLRNWATFALDRSI